MDWEEMREFLDDILKDVPHMDKADHRLYSELVMIARTEGDEDRAEVLLDALGLC